MEANICAIILISLIGLANSARILGVITTPSYSHQEELKPFWKELSLRGHQVTVLTTHPIGDPLLSNLTEIDTSSSIQIHSDMLPNIINSNKNVLKMLHLTTMTFVKVFEEQLNHPEVQSLLNNSTVKFDLLISEYILLAPLVLSQRFNCPYIGVITTEALNIMYSEMGNPAHPVAYPDPTVVKTSEFTLVSRLSAVFTSIIIHIYFKWISVPYQEDFVLKYFGQEYDLTELYQNASLLLVNSEPILHSNRPITPNVIRFGGKPLRLPSLPLSKDLQEILDSDQRGFIYFSLGTNVDTKEFSSKTLSTILEVFKELPYTIIWKYDLVDLSDKPENVVILKWVPQIQVLEHPNLKLFITHGGIQSVQEAIFAGVPMLGMPVFVDQPHNIQELVNRGCALSVDYRTLTASHLKKVILELIDNIDYRNRVKALRSLIEDQPWTPLERAVWWTEYVLRHNGAKHLRSPILDIPFYQYYFLDVVGVALVFVIVVVLVFLVIIKTLLRLLRRVWSAKVKVQ